MASFQLQTIDGYLIDTALTECGHRDVAIWLHGITSDKDETLGLFREGAQRLQGRDVSSLRFDFRGHGSSSGAPTDFSIVGQSLDTHAVLDYARRKFPYARFHLIGMSFGAPPTIFAAARYAQVHTVTLIAPVLSYRRTILEPETPWAKGLYSDRNLHELETTGHFRLEADFCISVQLVEEMRLIRPDLALKALKQPVLIVHGNRDSMVPYEASVDAAEEASHVRLVTVDGADHGFTAEGDDEGVSPRSIANKERIYQLLAEHIGLS